jgi:hypothetical protein
VPPCEYPAQLSPGSGRAGAFFACWRFPIDEKMPVRGRPSARAARSAGAFFAGTFIICAVMDGQPLLAAARSLKRLNDLMAETLDPGVLLARLGRRCGRHSRAIGGNQRTGLCPRMICGRLRGESRPREPGFGEGAKSNRAPCTLSIYREMTLGILL